MNSFLGRSAKSVIGPQFPTCFDVIYDCHMLPSHHLSLRLSPTDWSIRLICETKRHYLFTCKVSRYCFLALHNTIQTVLFLNGYSYTNTQGWPNIGSTLGHASKVGPVVTYNPSERAVFPLHVYISRVNIHPWQINWNKQFQVYKISRNKQCNNPLLNLLTSRPGCMPESRYTGVGVLFFVIWSWNC